MTGIASAGTAADRFDPITLEVIRHRLDKIAEEMQLTLLSLTPRRNETLPSACSGFSIVNV